MRLQMRFAAGLGPATVDEIFDALLAGGYRFDAMSGDAARRGVTISIGKNTQTFQRQPGGRFGLCEWYAEPPAEKVAPVEPETEAVEPETEAGVSHADRNN